MVRHLRNILESLPERGEDTVTPTYLNPPVHYAVPEFRAMLAALKLGVWRPKFPTLHNTGAPSLAQWLAYGPTPQERWGASLNNYYRGLGWHAGPHLVVCPDYVWVLCNLTLPGVSVSCWNSETFGIEMVGDYDLGAQDQFNVGDGAKVRDNAASVLAALAEKFGWGDLNDYQIGARGLHFHRECVADHHSCPGAQVSKPDMLTRVAALRGALGPISRAPTVSAPAAALTPSQQAAITMRAAVKTFQHAAGLTEDGDPGRLTEAAYQRALDAATAA